MTGRCGAKSIGIGFSIVQAVRQKKVPINLKALTISFSHHSQPLLCNPRPRLDVNVNVNLYTTLSFRTSNAPVISKRERLQFTPKNRKAERSVS